MTSAESGSTLRELRRAWLPVVLVLAVFATLVAVIVLSQRVGDSGEPPEPPPFAGLQPVAITVMDVRARSSDVLTLVDQRGLEIAFTVDSAAAVERLRPVEATDIEVDDTINIVGIPNEVLSFSIHFIVVMAAPASSRNGVAYSEAGFAGHEAALDRADRPVLSGVVETIAASGDLVTLTGPDGPMTLRLNESEPARIYRLESVDAATIAEGDRLAANFAATPIDALLVMPLDE